MNDAFNYEEFTEGVASIRLNDRAKKNFDYAGINNQRMNEVTNKIDQFGTKLQNLDALIPIQNELMLWNGN
jgi:hypothetical protein